MKRSLPNALFCVLLVIATAAASAESSDDWTRFRGPNGSGVGSDRELPTGFSPDSAVWVREVAFGRSSPVIENGIVYLTGADEKELFTIGYSAETGDELWRRSVPRLRIDDVYTATGPSVASPTGDSDGVYSFFPEYGLVAYGREGQERWQIELPPFSSYYGVTASPILENGVLILLCDQTLNPFILGVEAATGRELWRRERENRAESWTTPVVHRPGTPQAQVLTFGTWVIDSYDPRTGEHNWRLPGFGPTPVSSPIVDGDRLYVVAPDQAEESAPPSFESFATLDVDENGGVSRQEISSHPWATTFDWLDIDRDGNATLEEIGSQIDLMVKSTDFGLVAVDLSSPSDPEILWRQTKTLPYIASPILYRGVLFLVKDGGILTSYDPASGEVLKRGRISGVVEPFYPSPIAAGGKIYLTSSAGSIAVVSATGDWETLNVSELDEEVFASPAVSGGRMYLRTRTRLYAFGE